MKDVIVMNETRQSGQFVVPGQKLGVIEEFIPNSGTFVENGVIRSKNVGYMLMDFANKKVSVYPAARNLNVPRVGSIIVGNTTGVQSSLAIIRIKKVGSKIISGYFTGVIHISDVSFRYTDSMFESFKLGDLVRAKVISDKNHTYHLSTKGEKLGVVLAYCSQCGNVLSLKGRGLRCEACGNVERRKIASDYGEGTL